MKKIIFILFSIVALLSFSACEDDNSPIFTNPSEEGVSFTNAFAVEYLLSEATESNIAERFVWNNADFGAPVNITYELQGSVISTFDTFDIVGSTSETNQSINIDLLLDYASDLGLDDDPGTTNADGSPNNIGKVYFRIRAYTGAGAANTEEMFTDIQALDITVVEVVADAGCDSLFAVGGGLVGIGWNFSDDGELICENDILKFKVSLSNVDGADGLFRFFQTFGVWDTNNNYAYYVAESYTIDNRFEDDGGGDSNFRFIGTPGIYILTVDNVTKEITLEESGSLWAVGDATPGGWNWGGAETEIVQITPGVYQATFALANGIFRFIQTNGAWDANNNYLYYEDEGYTIDSNFENANDGDSNFSFIGTPGTFTLTINDNDKTITLE